MSKRVLDKSLFTTCFHKYSEASAIRKRYIIIYGGSSSSKSFSVHQKECLRLLGSSIQGDVLMVRKNSTDLRESCYKLIKQNYKQWGYADRFHFTYSGDNKAAHNLRTGRQFTFRGAADVSQMKSLAGYSRAVLEEADQLEFEDFTEIDRRVRHPTEFVQIILILNPVDENHWIKTKLIDGKGYEGQVVELHCTYHDNEYASQTDIDRLEALKYIDEYQYEVYVLGKWGVIRTGKEYIHQFSYPEHVQPCAFIPGQPVHLSWDFNSNPYLTLLCYQIVRDTTGGWIVQQFDEICGEPPANSVKAVSQTYLERYHLPYNVQSQRSPAFIYGDSQGNNRIEGTAGERRFDWVMDSLAPVLHNHSDRTLRKNPSVIRQRDFFNHILANKYPIKWRIDPRCKNTIQDYQKLKSGTEGFLVEYAKDPAGFRYEKYGHCYTAGSYFAIGVFPKEFETDMVRS